jgi:hypothetical protein
MAPPGRVVPDLAAFALQEAQGAGQSRAAAQGVSSRWSARSPAMNAQLNTELPSELRIYIKLKAVASRWPTRIRGSAQFVMLTNS